MKEEETKPRYGTAHFERRRHPRFNVNLPIEYRRADSSIKDGRTINASEGGFAAYFPEHLDVGQQLRAKLFFSFGPGLNAIEMVAEVAWVADRPEEGQAGYPTGLRFADISVQDLEKLKNFLVSLSR
jgi:c-di-GMP-binding flagellar brake protein YcgR